LAHLGFPTVGLYEALDDRQEGWRRVGTNEDFGDEPAKLHRHNDSFAVAYGFKWREHSLDPKHDSAKLSFMFKGFAL
jgi:hypothetical protein